MKIAIIDYEGGNLASVAWAVEHLGYQANITANKDEILGADKVILPGVGAAGATMSALNDAGLVEVLRRDLTEAKVPCLGICIGIQVLFEKSEEDDTATLGIFKGEVKRFPESQRIKVPHIGWNQVEFTKEDHPLLDGLDSSDHFYFVNSYYVLPEDESLCMGKTTYADITFTSFIQGKNWTATQFHLEKSGGSGLKLLKNFLKGPSLRSS